MPPALPVVRMVAFGVLGGCTPLTPPPALPLHAAVDADDKGATTVMLVLGTAGELVLGGDGWGAALRVEHQETTRTTVGLEVTGGRGGTSLYEDNTTFRHWLVGVRGYSRFAPNHESPAALLSGAGLSWSASGLVTGTLDAGVAFSYDAGLIPVVALGTALAIPLAHGRPYDEVPFGTPSGDREPMPPRGDWDFRAPKPNFRRPRTELYFWGGLGVLVPLGDTGNRISGDVSFAAAMLGHGSLLSLTVGDAQRLK